MTLQEKADISKSIIALSAKAYPNIFASCSFGKDSRVIVDLVMQVKPDMKFIGIDTGYEFPETLAFGDSLAEELKMNFEWIKSPKAEAERIEREYGTEWIKNNQYKCCEMKIPAMNSLLSNNNYSAWITGLRRDETAHRKNLGIVEPWTVAKVNPIAFWTKDDVWEYIHSNKLRYHPLYDVGYPSLGCKPCTTQGRIQEGGGRQGQFERAGRFTGSGNEGGECGLHTMFPAEAASEKKI